MPDESITTDAAPAIAPVAGCGETAQGAQAMKTFARFLVWLTRGRLAICEGCEGLWSASEFYETEDMVSLCPLCWKICLEDGDGILFEDMEDGA